MCKSMECHALCAHRHVPPSSLMAGAATAAFQQDKTCSSSKQQQQTAAAAAADAAGAESDEAALERASTSTARRSEASGGGGEAGSRLRWALALRRGRVPMMATCPSRVHTTASTTYTVYVSIDICTVYVQVSVRKVRRVLIPPNPVTDKRVLGPTHTLLAAFRISDVPPTTGG